MKNLFVSTILSCSCYIAFAQVPLFRYYNVKLQKHYYTVNFSEFGNGGNGWALEGVACQVYPRDFAQPDMTPVYRFFNQRTGDHYYTTGKFISRRDLIGYSLEGPVFCDYKHRVPGTFPLLEYYNPANGDHFYTINKAELGRGFEGYVFDNIAGFVMPK